MSTETVSKPTRLWREQDGVIYFSVTSDGTSGSEWVERLEKKGFRVGEKYTKSVLRSSDFTPTKGVTTEIEVLKGMLFSDDDRITKKIRAWAYAGTFTQGRKLFDPGAEISCLIREKFSDMDLEAMGLWRITAMHEPIEDSGSFPGLLGASRGGGGQWLHACWGRPGIRWHREDGFAFVVSQVSS